MATQRTQVRVPGVERRGPAAVTIQRRVTTEPTSSVRQRLGNRGMNAALSRRAAALEGGAAVRVAGSASAAPQLAKSTRLPAKVSDPHEATELEAEQTARKVVRMSDASPAPAQPAGSKHQGSIQRAALAAEPAAAAPVSSGGGAPLPPSVRGFMERRFGADFGNVRIHADEAAAERSAELHAHAFTIGQHVYFGRDEFQPQTSSGRELIAHELTHTIQQGAAIQRSADLVAVTQHGEPHVARFASGIFDGIASRANAIPGFRLLTIVLGVNPINLAPVEANAANLLRALLELIPGVGPVLVQALDSHGIFAKVGAWFEPRVRALGLVGSALKSALERFLDSLGLRDVLDIPGAFERAKRIFTEPIQRLIDLGTSVVADIVGFVRSAILLPLAKLAEGTRGYDLLKAVLGEDPVTGQPVSRTAETLLGGFMKFIGHEEVWQNLQKSNAVPRAFAWFQGALTGLLAYVRRIPGMLSAALAALTVSDLIRVPTAFAKVASVFGGFALEFVPWGGSAVWKLLEIIFEVVSPATLAYLRKTGAALHGILQNPVPFVKNLVRAAKLGFEHFAGNFAAHLKEGLLDWLTGALPGVYIPKALSLPELVKFVFSVLGLSWANVRAKLVKVVGEPAVKTMETGFESWSRS